MSPGSGAPSAASTGAGPRHYSTKALLRSDPGGPPEHNSSQGPSISSPRLFEPTGHLRLRLKALFSGPCVSASTFHAHGEVQDPNGLEGRSRSA